MGGVPDELWRQILEMGIQNSKLNYKDLCCISISCRRLHRLSAENSLWLLLLSSDFPSPNQQNPNPNNSTSASAKSTYKIKFEREKSRKVAAHRRAVLRKESEVLEFERKIREIENGLRQETEKMRATAAELSNLHKVRQASVALNVWQPEVIRGRQKQIVEQSAVPVESRVHSLEMELKLCRQRISGFDKAYRDEKRRLELAMEQLASMKYHPLRDHKLINSGDKEHKKKRKKLKTSVIFPEKQG
uniref:F-box domain-containing protein n=2 Tax=Populus trichocarpa TaxID=3694 RepID=A0A2K1Y238_POPTR|eukprot:XP_006375925.2 F-box protein SKIP24 isoform X1 [Populus trichocarpa]